VRGAACLGVVADADLVEFGGAFAISRFPSPCSFLSRLTTSTGHCHLQITLVLAAFILDAIAMLGIQGLSLAYPPRDGLGLQFSLALRSEV
jgi:hypothetical protein